MNNRTIILNSTLLFVIAFLWQTTFHELGHFFAAVYFQAKDIGLFHNYAYYDTSALSLPQMLIVVAAGPLVSLFIGVVFHALCALYSKRNLFFLFMLYMSAFGYICFAGYLMVAPFFENGDTGFIFSQLGFPLWSVIAFALAAIGFVMVMAKYLGKYFVEMAPKSLLKEEHQQKKFADVLIKYPLFIGVVLSTLLNLPVMAFLSLLYPLCNPMNLFWVYGYAIDTNYNSTIDSKHFYQLERIQPLLIGVFALTVLVNRLLVYGFYW